MLRKSYVSILLVRQMISYATKTRVKEVSRLISFMEDRFNELVEEGLRFFELGEYEDCIEIFSEAIGYVKFLNREDQLLKLMIRRADCYYHKGDFRRVVKHCNYLARYVEEMDEENLFDLYEMWAISLAQLGKYEEAIIKYNRLIQLSAPKAEFKAFTGLGLVYYHQAKYNNQVEKYNTALFYYEKALKQEGIDIKDTTMVLHNIGMVNYEQRDYQKALSRYSEVVRFNIEEYLPYTYNELAKVYIRLDELELANEYIDKAAIMLTNAMRKDQIEIARNFFVKALYYKGMKEYDTAIFFFKLALNELKDREIIAEMANVYQQMAAIYKDMDPDRAIDCLAEARSYYKMLMIK